MLTAAHAPEQSPILAAELAAFSVKENGGKQSLSAV